MWKTAVCAVLSGFILTGALGVAGWRLGECYLSSPTQRARGNSHYYASEWFCRWRGFKECGECKPFPWGVYLVFDGTPADKLVANSSDPWLRTYVSKWGLGPNSTGLKVSTKRLLQVQTTHFLISGIRNIQPAVWLEQQTSEHDQGILCPDLKVTPEVSRPAMPGHR